MENFWNCNALFLVLELPVFGKNLTQGILLELKLTRTSMCQSQVPHTVGHWATGFQSQGPHFTTGYQILYLKNISLLFFTCDDSHPCRLGFWWTEMFLLVRHCSFSEWLVRFVLIGWARTRSICTGMCQIGKRSQLLICGQRVTFSASQTCSTSMYNETA